MKFTKEGIEWRLTPCITEIVTLIDHSVVTTSCSLMTKFYHLLCTTVISLSSILSRNSLFVVGVNNQDLISMELKLYASYLSNWDKYEEG